MFTPEEKKPAKLLHLVGNSRFGGASRIILRLGQIAKAEGWQVDILATDPVFGEAVTQHGLGLVKLDVIRRRIRPLWDLGGLVRLIRFLRREPYHVVHTHTSKVGFVGRLAARLAGVPVIVHTVHGFAFHESSPVWKRLFYSSLERIASRCCDRIVSVSEFHRGWALELGICSSARIVAIPNGVPVPPPNMDFEPAEVRLRLGAQADDLLILSIARLAKDKGIDHLIEAAAMLPRNGRRYLIVVAGDGPVRTQLEELASRLQVTDRVTFLGFREDVGALLAACDLVVLPSLREGLSMTLLEAMAAGKPIIATSIGSHRELAAQADIARLVEPADPRGLCNAILRISLDRALMARLGASARLLFERRYTEDRMLSAYRELYVDLLAAKCPAEVTARCLSLAPSLDLSRGGEI